MKLRTQLIISMAFFGIALLIISASFISTNHQVDRLNKQEALATNIELKANELGYLSNDYLLYRESQQLDRWNSKYSSLSDDIANLSVDTPDQQALVDNIQGDLQRLKAVFDDVVANASVTQHGSYDPAFIQVSWSRIGVQTQGMVFDAARLSQKLRDEGDQEKQMNSVLAGVLLGTFAAFLLVNYFFIYRNTLRSISALQAGARIIGSGNLDHTIDEKQSDEFGALAGAFNRMTARLKTVMASKADLEKEISERGRAEAERERLLEQLKAKTSELEKANEALGIKTEELAAQAEEIECSNEELRTNNDELLKVTASLRETQDYLESLINYANAPIIVWDPGFIITRFNRAFERLSGYAAGEVLGKDLSILFPPESRGESLDRIKRTLAGEQWESVEIPIRHKLGGTRIALWNSANIYAASGSMLATIAQGQDITARKQAEKELEEEKAQAELYLDLMGHDISNMHQVAMMHLELAGDTMSTRGRLEAEDKALIDTAFRTLERAARLIDNVRKLQKIKSGEYRMETVDLAKVLGGVLDVYSGIPGRNITINYTPNGECPVRANPLLKDVFSNLVDNAVKHSGDPLVIYVDICRIGLNGNSYYRVAIEDNGNGIPDEKKDEVFQRFGRGQTKARGTGLGLYLVKSLMEGFGGYVEGQNRILGDHTKGTRFLVYLPTIEEEINAGK